MEIPDPTVRSPRSRVAATRPGRNTGGDVMASRAMDKGRLQQSATERATSQRSAAGGSPSAKAPGPDMMLGLWTSWMETHSGIRQGWTSPGKPWWGLSSDDLLGNMLAGGVKQLNETLAKAPLLGSIDQIWNANPLRDVVPIDWAEVARALRTVWLRSLGRPETALTSVAKVSARAWQSALDAWNDAGKRWWGLTDPDAAAGAPQRPGDKRFAAPEWQQNPNYRPP